MDYNVNMPGVSPQVLEGNARVYQSAPMPPAPSATGDATTDYLLGLLSAGAAIYQTTRRPEGSEGAGKLRMRNPQDARPVQTVGAAQGEAQADQEDRAGLQGGNCLLLALLAALLAGLLWRSWVAALIGGIVGAVACYFLGI